MTDVGGEGTLAPLLTSISELPLDTSTAFSDDPFSRFISLRSTTTTTTRKNTASLCTGTSLPFVHTSEILAANCVCLTSDDLLLLLLLL